MNKLSVLFLCIIIGLGSSIGGYSLGKINTPAVAAPSTLNPLITRLMEMPEGSEITITESEFEKITRETEYNGALSEKVYFDWPGIWGTTAMDAAIGDQGIHSGDVTVGRSKGASWITGLWNFIKSIFWFLVIYFALWLILSAVSLVWPPAGIIAGIMAAIATGGISAISGLINWFKKKKTETALKQTVEGVDAFKAANPDAKEAINVELKKAQDSNSKDVVDAIRK